jgi:hypothetical protein
MSSSDTTRTFEVDDILSPRGDYIEYDGITVRWELVDEALATDWLENYNTHNRTITETRVNGHVRDMVANNWPITGDTIRFANVTDPETPGGVRKVLIDGQHRAEAIRRSKTSQVCLIVEGLHLDVQEVVDTGKPRSYADTLTLRGVANGPLNAAIVRRVVLYKRGALPQSGGAASTPTKTELDAFFVPNEAAVYEATRLAYKVAKSSLAVPGSVIGAAYFLCAEKDALGAKIFFEDQLIDVTGIEIRDPAHRLRARLEKAKAEGMTGNEAFLYAIKAWGHFRKGERLDRLQSPRGGWPKDITDLPIY